MLDDYFHVSIGGVKFRLAESVEGDHYIEHGDPLRPQTYATIGGVKPGETFQMRPDTLLWSWTDWSGGEGQYKYSPDALNRYWTGNVIDPFEQPGTLRVGPAVEETLLAGGGTLSKNVIFVRAMGKLYAINESNRNLNEWDDAADNWKAAVTNSLGVSAKGAAMAYGDTKNLFYREKDAATIFKWDGTTFTTWNNDTAFTSNNGSMVCFGNYIYMWNPNICKLWEIPKSGTAPVASVLLYDLSDEDGGVTNAGAASLTVGDNRIYIMQLKEGDTHIHEAVPTTAAGTGYGRAIARIPGFVGEALTYHMGFLYIVGKNLEDATQTDYTKHVLYLQPGGQFGSLGELRRDETVNKHALMSDTTQSMMLAHFVQYVNSASKPLLFAIDAVSGGIACLSKYGYTGVDGAPHRSLGQFQGDIFWSSSSTATEAEVWRTLRDTYYQAGTGDSNVVSSVWDFGLVEPKVAQSMRLVCDPLPANWTIHLDYQKDVNGTWVNAGSYTTTGGTGTTYMISTDSATVTFKTMQMRVRFNYTDNTGVNPTTTPVLHAVEFRAAVVTKINAWDIVVELSDEAGQAQDRSWNGQKLINELRTICTADTVKAFKNGYGSAQPNTYSEYDVFIDQWLLKIARPGEGWAYLKLVEVT